MTDDKTTALKTVSFRQDAEAREATDLLQSEFFFLRNFSDCVNFSLRFTVRVLITHKNLDGLLHLVHCLQIDKRQWDGVERRQK